MGRAKRPGGMSMLGRIWVGTQKTARGPGTQINREFKGGEGPPGYQHFWRSSPKSGKRRGVAPVLSEVGDDKVGGIHQVLEGGKEPRGPVSVLRIFPRGIGLRGGGGKGRGPVREGTSSRVSWEAKAGGQCQYGVWVNCNTR